MKEFTECLEQIFGHIERRCVLRYFTVAHNMMGSDKILRVYMEKDFVEKLFIHSKQSVEPLYTRTDANTRARMFLAILKYAMMRMIFQRLGLSYLTIERVFSGISEVIYSNESQATVELKKEQKSMLEKPSSELY